MVPNELVHSGILPLEHERAYARLLGKLEYMTEFGSGILDLWHVLQKNRKNFAKSNFFFALLSSQGRIDYA